MSEKIVPIRASAPESEMNVRTARELLSEPLRFGDERQIEALAICELVAAFQIRSIPVPDTATRDFLERQLADLKRSPLYRRYLAKGGDA